MHTTGNCTSSQPHQPRPHYAQRSRRQRRMIWPSSRRGQSLPEPYPWRSLGIRQTETTLDWAGPAGGAVAVLLIVVLAVNAGRRGKEVASKELKPLSAPAAPTVKKPNDPKPQDRPEESARLAEQRANPPADSPKKATKTESHEQSSLPPATTPVISAKIDESESKVFTESTSARHSRASRPSMVVTFKMRRKW